LAVEAGAPVAAIGGTGGASCGGAAASGQHGTIMLEAQIRACRGKMPMPAPAATAVRPQRVRHVAPNNLSE
jgi:hypothetical protein